MGARMKAVSQSRKVKVFFPDPHQYKICDDANNDGSVDDCEGTAQIKDLQSSYAGVSVSATLNPLFSPKGSTANYTTITLTNTSGSKTITIEITGHVSIN
jgi:Type II transport protein GspH